MTRLIRDKETTKNKNFLLEKLFIKNTYIQH